MKTAQQSQARDLYLNTTLTQKDIARYLSVSEKTVYLWIKQHAWDRLKQASLAAPALIADNLFNQVVELQAHIAGREEGNRFPSQQEADITRKLILCIEKLKLYPSQGACMQMMRSFLDFVGGSDAGLQQQLMQYAKDFLEGKGANGFKPYDISYKAATPEELQAEAIQAQSADEQPLSVHTETSNEISASENETKPENPVHNEAETQSGQAIEPSDQTAVNPQPPEKTGNLSANKQTQSTTLSFEEALARQREINHILEQMKNPPGNKKSNKYF